MKILQAVAAILLGIGLFLGLQLLPHGTGNILILTVILILPLIASNYFVQSHH
ncbi:MAG TPA: hypothetical protein VE862_02820 [Candidatus Acidoferrum sp.]|nr:hypothetical protein [Candidatus Acidoferrum sp.]